VQSFSNIQDYIDRDDIILMEVSRLIERCRQGDTDALGELYEAYAQRMRGVCRKYISDEQGVDDVLHDAFVIIFTSFDRLRDNRKAESWMMSIARNVAAKYKERITGVTMVPIEEAATMSQHTEQTDVRGVPLEDVLHMVERLPEGYGKVFRLSVFEGMSHKEIADMLGIEPHSSSSQLARAKKILRKMMQQYWAAVLLLLVLPLTFFLLKKSDTAVKEEKPIAAKKKEKQKESPVEQPQEQPVIVSISAHHAPIDTLRTDIALALDSITPDLIAQEQTTPDSKQKNEQADTTHVREKLNHPNYDITDLFPDKPVTSPHPKQRWSIDLAYAGGMGEQRINRPYSFTETPTLAITGEPPSPVTFENWSDYAAFLAEEPDDGSIHSRSVIMNIALNNVGDAAGTGADKIVRRSRHDMPINFALALKYRLSSRFALETALSYSRLNSEFEMGSNGNTINEQQTIHYLGIPVKCIYSLYDGKAWSLYGSAGLTMEVPVYAPLSTRYYLHGALEATDKTTIRAPWQWSVGTGLGLQYNLTPNIGLFAEPSLQYYIPTGTQIETYRTDHPFTFSLPLGIRFTW